MFYVRLILSSTVGPTKKQLQLGGQSGTLQSVTFGFQVQHPNHSAMLPTA